MVETNLGKNISVRRHELHLTQEQLAASSDISVNFLSKIERASAQRISAITLFKIASALDTSMDNLMGKHEQSDHSTEDGPYFRQLVELLRSFDYSDSEEASHSIIKLLKLHKKSRN